MALLIGLNSNPAGVLNVPQTFSAPGQPLIATNALDTDALVKLTDASIGRHFLAASFQKHEKAIVAAWPAFVKDAKARGVQVTSELWSDFVRQMHEQIEAREASIKAELMKNLKPELAANALTAGQLALCAQMDVTPEQFLAVGPQALSPAESQLTAAQLKIVKALGVTAEAFLNEPGERRR